MEQTETIEQTEIEGQAEKCNCNDEYRTEVCPIHYIDKTPEYKDHVIILTDDDIVPSQIVTWIGHGFICKKCKKEIIHNMNYCGGCGSKLLVQSKIVTEYINKISQKS